MLLSNKFVCMCVFSTQQQTEKEYKKMIYLGRLKTKRETMEKTDFNHILISDTPAPLDPMRKSVGGMLFGMLLVFEVTALLRKSDEVREDHAAKADMVERYDRIGLNVFGMIII